MTKQEYAEAIALLSAAFNRQMPKEQHRAWYAVVSDIDAEPFRAAVIAFLAEGDDWPTIAKLRRLATEQVHGVASDSHQAYINVKKAMKKYHPDVDGSVGEAMKLLTNREYQAVQSVGGFSRFFDCTVDEVSFLRTQFEKAFNSFSGTERRMENLPEAVRPKLAHESALKKLSQRMGAIES